MPRGDHWQDWKTRLSAASAVDANGCHVWQNALNSRGYGVIYFDGKLHLAHRAAWFRKYGTWPTRGLVLDHVCENKACVNVEHLREVTNRFNITRNKKSPSQINHRGNQCANGHEYPADGPLDAVGRRRCPVCISTKKRRVHLVV